MTTFLVCIPTELLEPICSGLAPGDLLSLCRSCKTLYSKAHLLLFRHVTIDWVVSAAPEKPPKITRLLEFILRSPNYAQYIKRVDVVNISYDNFIALSKRWIDRGIRSPLSLRRQEDDSLATLVKEVLGELCLPESDKWYQGVVDDADLGAIVALFLAQCTHLESLSVNLSFIAPSCSWSTGNNVFPPYNPWFPAMIKHAMSAPEEATRLSRFDRLAHFTVSAPGETYGHPLEIPKDVFLFSFYLPNITTLCLYNVPDHAKREYWDLEHGSHLPPFWPLPNDPLPSKLTTLRLIDSSAHASTVEFLLRQTPNLQSLVYGHKDLKAHMLILPHLQRALDHVRGTLTQLTVKFDAGDPLPELALVMGDLGSLSSMPALEDLEISLGLLFGQSVTPQSAPPLSAVLPARLKRLTINDDLLTFFVFNKWRGKPTGAVLEAFFGGDWKSATPLLEEFVLDLRRNGGTSEYWEQEENREELRQMVQNQGIRCSVLWDADRERVDMLISALEWELAQI